MSLNNAEVMEGCDNLAFRFGSLLRVRFWDSGKAVIFFFMYLLPLCGSFCLCVACVFTRCAESGWVLLCVLAMFVGLDVLISETKHGDCLLDQMSSSSVLVRVSISTQLS